MKVIARGLVGMADVNGRGIYTRLMHSPGAVSSRFRTGDAKTSSHPWPDPRAIN